MAHGFRLIDTVNGFSEWRHQANGLEALIFPTPVAPVVSFGVVYRVGSRNESTGQTGATHILEHLMFKGTERYNRDNGTDIARLLHQVGASYNATTWLDRTNYYETLPSEHLELAVAIEADRMRGALVCDEDLESERRVVLNELERGESDPSELLLKASFAQAYLEHPYRHPTIGWPSDVEAVNGEVIRRYYDTYYHPDNATVMVAGAFDERELLELLERRLGSIPPAPRPIPEVVTVESPQRGERRFRLHRVGEVGCLALTWHVPDGLHPDMPALSVLAQILAEGVTSRLQQRLVESNRCLSVHAYPMELRDPGVFQVFATLAPDQPHSEVEALIRRELEALQRDVPTGAEVERARMQVRTDLAFQWESPAALVSGLTESVAIGDWRRFVRDMELISAVEASDVTRVAVKYLDDMGLTAGWFIPEGGDGGLPGDPHPAPRPCSLSRRSAPRPCYLAEPPDAPFAERVRLSQLECGARLAVLESPHVPTVTIAGSLRAGLTCQKDGRFTVPVVTGAMLERGTARHSRLELADELEGRGLQVAVDASTTAAENVFFTAQGLAEELPRMASLLVEVLREPVFPPEELQRFKDRIRASLTRERHETFPRAYAALTRRLFPAGYPLHRRTIETRLEEVESVSREEVRRFHTEVYGPETMVLAVAGQVDAEQVHATFERLLGGWRASGNRPSTWPEPGPQPPGEERIALPDRPNLDVLIGHRGRLLRGDPGYAAAVLANSCLGQSTLTSRLGAVVRDQEGLTYGVFSRFFGTLRIPGPWAIFLTVSPKDLDRAGELCRSLLADYIRTGPDEAELEGERQSLAGSYRVGLATTSSVARELVTMLSAGLPISSLDDYPRQLLECDKGTVVEAIRRHFHPEELSLTVAGTFVDPAD